MPFGAPLHRHMKKWEIYLHKIWNGGKLFIIGVVVLLITFTLGTFKPNKNIVKKIEAVQEQKTISVLKKFCVRLQKTPTKNPSASRRLKTKKLPLQKSKNKPGASRW